MKIREKKIEAVCDCGASVSFLSPFFYDELKQTHKLDLNRCVMKLRAANGLPNKVKGVVRLPVVIGPISYDHDFRVLDKPVVCSALTFSIQINVTHYFFA